MDNITRIEIIGPKGREFTRWLKGNETVTYQLKDDGQTIKFFISTTSVMPTAVDFVRWLETNFEINPNAKNGKVYMPKYEGIRGLTLEEAYEQFLQQ